MRILRIAAKNLASLAGEVEIPLDRGPLAQAGVFAITGPTGAGKSTLLDAICLALFDRTPRLRGGGAKVGTAEQKDADRIRAGDVRSILRKGTAEAWAEVDFLGADERRHRARWEVRRARNKVDGRVQAQTMELTDLQSGERLATKKGEVLREIEARLGLTFDQFRRSVLLAQGDFAAFLAAEESERAELLEKMTGTEIYGWISMEAHRREGEEARLEESLKERLEEVGLLEEEERAALRARLPALEEQIEARSAEAAALEAAARHYKSLDRLLREEAEAKEKAEATAREREGWAEREAMLSALALLEPLRPLFAARERAAEAERRARRSLEAATRAQEEAGAKRAEAEAGVEGARSRLSGLDALQAPDREAAEQRAERAEAEAALAALDRQAALHESRALERARAALGRMREAREAFAASQEEETRARAEAEESGRLHEEREEQARACALRVREAEARCQEARRALEAARAAVDLEERRHDLREGEPCPLCGSQAHPWSEHLPPLNALLEAQRERVAELEGEERGARAEEGRLRAEAKEAQARARRRRAQAETEADRQRECRTKWDQSQENIHFLQTKTAIGEENSIPLLKKLDAELVERLAVQAREEAAQAKVEARAKAARSAEKEARDRRSALRQAHQEAQEGARRALKEAERALLGARERGAEARAKAEAAEGAAKAAGEAFEEAAGALKAALEEAGIEEEEAEARLRPEGASVEEIGAWRAQIGRLKEEATRSEAVLRERTRKREAHEAEGPPAHPLEGLEGAQARCRAALDEARASRQATERRLTLDEAAQENAAELRLRLAEQRSRAGLYRTLARLIGSADGKKFRVFAQSLTLDLLLGHANRHLRELSPRYSLERVPGHDLALQVLDHEMGDEIRSVRSLSGGETFLVSLGLALGLATLTSERTRVDSLFIDEGFGSLDPESLEMALSTLDALQATGRQVGLISHVPAVAERFDVRVHVESVAPSRSRVRVLPELLSRRTSDASASATSATSRG